MKESIDDTTTGNCNTIVVRLLQQENANRFSGSLSKFAIQGSNNNLPVFSLPLGINSCNIIFNKINIDSSDNVTEKFNFSSGQKNFMIKPSKVTESINNLLNSWQNFPVFLFNLDPVYGDKDHVKK